MSYNPFHAKTVDAAEQRPAADVFRLSVQASDAAISSRFASGGKYTIEQLEAGADEAAPAPAEASEFDPDDKRSLYERLKAQKDAKQEEFEHRNAFKNQMDHWKLDDDDAAFEDERRQRQFEQQQESARLHQEGAEFYRLARAAQQTVAKPAVSIAPPVPSIWEGRARAEKRKLPTKPTGALRVVKTQPGPAACACSGSAVTGGTAPGGGSCSTCAVSAASTVASGAAATATHAATAIAMLPGMGDYGSDEDEVDE
ncbi:hypothetical protein Ctob_008418 [Chrysochromulina tobinii]|uniref:FAM192A/Fyv6 N-terminal domain-containing protein n=1 Tax=Chrysochromulina tobinii TaxID=1460289 RepID=A0A0M0KAS3_9EUKA|nr:hypothetical protein Ctob_008418 [Chrysochromulina tobinii]|eukprot:KOO35935.1 hypothetical protein Ctob_008418 [Chrysochromulina sp. CCMP291]